MSESGTGESGPSQGTSPPVTSAEPTSAVDLQTELSLVMGSTQVMRLSRTDSGDTTASSRKSSPRSHCTPDSTPTFQTFVKRVGCYKETAQKLMERMLLCERTLASIEGKLDDMNQMCQKWKK